MPVPVILLASASPRRRELLAAAGVAFRVVPSAGEEVHDLSVPPPELAERNACAKALEVSARHPGDLVLGADTLVVVDGHPLGKPADRAAAAAMLRRLSGRAHEVVTGVCLARGGRVVDCFHAATTVRFGRLDESTITRYHALVDPLDKAGAYAIQEGAHLLGARAEGSLSNVIGLPVEELVARLQRLGGGALGALTAIDP